MKIYTQVKTPIKSSKLSSLTENDGVYNRSLLSRCMKFENIFAQVKVFKFFSTTYRNRRKRFGLRINLVAGIINFESRSCLAGGLLYSREVMIEFLKKQLYKIRVSALFDFK